MFTTNLECHLILMTIVVSEHSFVQSSCVIHSHLQYLMHLPNALQTHLTLMTISYRQTLQVIRLFFSLSVNLLRS